MQLFLNQKFIEEMFRLVSLIPGAETHPMQRSHHPKLSRHQTVECIGEGSPHQYYARLWPHRRRHLSGLTPEKGFRAGLVCRADAGNQPAACWRSGRRRDVKPRTSRGDCDQAIFFRRWQVLSTYRARRVIRRVWTFAPVIPLPQGSPTNTAIAAAARQCFIACH
jgi:hypothetical protein